MHIPDGFLDLKTAAATGVLAAGGLAFALSHARRTIPQKRVPLLGLGAAFVFAAQMLNFPVAGGTSGHLMGGTLMAVLLGPSAAVVVIAAVLIVQCFLFADGGVTALGANIFNMAIVGGVGGWAIYAMLARVAKAKAWRVASAALAAWAGTVMASICCAFELAASKQAPLSVVLPAMAGVHVLIGVGEAIITAMVLSSIWATRPDLRAETRPAGAVSFTPLMVYGGLVALWLAVFVSPWASNSPDGLDKTAGDLGFESSAKTVMVSPMADYKVAFVSREAISTSVAGAVGTLVVFALAWMAARVLVAKASPVAVVESARLDGVDDRS